MILEFDALRGTKGAFYGDQHSIQGSIGIAAAIAIAEYLDRKHLPGTIFLYSTPGEERLPPVAKIDMFRAGMLVVSTGCCAATLWTQRIARLPDSNVLPEKPRLWL